VPTGAIRLEIDITGVNVTDEAKFGKDVITELSTATGIPSSRFKFVGVVVNPDGSVQVLVDVLDSTTVSDPSTSDVFTDITNQLGDPSSNLNKDSPILSHATRVVPVAHLCNGKTVTTSCDESVHHPPVIVSVSGGTPIGAIVGGAVGGAVGLAAIIAVYVLCCRKKSEKM